MKKMKRSIEIGDLYYCYNMINKDDSPIINRLVLTQYFYENEKAANGKLFTKAFVSDLGAERLFIPEYTLSIFFEQINITSEIRSALATIGMKEDSHPLLIKDVNNIFNPDITVPGSKFELLNEPDLEKIRQAILVVQRIDPIPERSFLKISEVLPDYNLKNINKYGKIIDFCESGRFEDARSLALELSSEEDHDALIWLANWYAERPEHSKLQIEVLGCIKSNSPHFKAAQEQLFAYAQSVEIPQNDKEARDLLEFKLKTAYNSGNSCAQNFLAQLCGYDGMNPTILNVHENTAAALVDFATLVREKDELIKRLEQQVQRLEQQIQRPEQGAQRKETSDLRHAFF